MLKYLLQDLHRYKKKSRNILSTFFFIPGCRYMFTFRACQFFSKYNPLGILFRIWNKRMQVKYGFQFLHTCKIGSGLFMAHYGNIVINTNSQLGNNCNIAQGVTIGNTKRGRKKGNPIIGNRVWIGTNAVIVGNIKIGDDVLIAPLSYINFDVPSNAVVAGNPAVIINYNGSSGYVENLA
ncbi:MAG: serine acetyltransferase [Bacteroidetes bacterium]|nr:serine acetyltransferase [Bacteroidota bacterium]